MSRIIIFGCGGVGIKAMHKLIAEGNEIVCFADNSKSKWGTYCENMRVISPQEILQEKFDYIAIGVFKAADIIRKQLHEMQICDKQIVIPIEPDKLFPNKEKISTDELVSFQQNEYISKNTLAYQQLNIKITDEVFLQKLDNLKETLIRNNIPREKVCIVSGAVLQVFGLRESKEFDDIDIIMTNDLRELYGNGLVIVSDSAEMHVKDTYDISDEEIIRSRDCHFLFCDLKIMHPSILYEYGKKINSSEYNLLERYCNLGKV